MAEEDIVFQLLEEERKSRIRRIAGTRQITVEDCLVIGILRLNREVLELRPEFMGEISKLRVEINELRREMASNFRWTLGLIIGMWINIGLFLIPILLKLVGII